MPFCLAGTQLARGMSHKCNLDTTRGGGKALMICLGTDRAWLCVCPQNRLGRLCVGGSAEVPSRAAAMERFWAPRHRGWSEPQP